MRFRGIDTRTPTEATRAEIASAVEQIVAAVAEEHGLMEACDMVSLGSRLDNDLGMDEVDLIEVLSSTPSARLAIPMGEPRTLARLSLAGYIRSAAAIARRAIVHGSR